MQTIPSFGRFRSILFGFFFATLAACGTQEVIGDVPVVDIIDGYGVLEDGE